MAVPAVDFRTGERWDLAAIVARAHAAGAVVVADLSHAVGVLPVDLDGLGVDLAVGCTYKYLNGGPGAPAFVYVAAAAPRRPRPAADRLDRPRRPVRDDRGVDARRPASGACASARRRCSRCSPSTAALSVFDGVALAGVHAASLALGDAFLDALPAGVDVVTPREHARRGGHVAVRVRDAEGLCAALARRGVVVDARPPDLLRFGFAAPYVTLDDARDRRPGARARCSAERTPDTRQRRGVCRH